MGLPGVVVSTGMVGAAPVGVQVIAGRYREDLCLLAGEAIEAGARADRSGPRGRQFFLTYDMKMAGAPSGGAGHPSSRIKDPG